MSTTALSDFNKTRPNFLDKLLGLKTEEEKKKEFLWENYVPSTATTTFAANPSSPVINQMDIAPKPSLMQTLWANKASIATGAAASMMTTTMLSAVGLGAVAGIGASLVRSGMQNHVKGQSLLETAKKTFTDSATFKKAAISGLFATVGVAGVETFNNLDFINAAEADEVYTVDSGAQAPSPIPEPAFDTEEHTTNDGHGTHTPTTITRANAAEMAKDLAAQYAPQAEMPHDPVVETKEIHPDDVEPSPYTQTSLSAEQLKAEEALADIAAWEAEQTLTETTIDPDTGYTVTDYKPQHAFQNSALPPVIDSMQPATPQEQDIPCGAILSGDNTTYVGSNDEDDYLTTGATTCDIEKTPVEQAALLKEHPTAQEPKSPITITSQDPQIITEAYTTETETSTPVTNDFNPHGINSATSGEKVMSGGTTTTPVTETAFIETDKMYAVSSGDTLWGIVKEEYGLTDASEILKAVDWIANENGMTGTQAENLKIGQEIILPKTAELSDELTQDWVAMDNKTPAPAPAPSGM